MHQSSQNMPYFVLASSIPGSLFDAGFQEISPEGIHCLSLNGISQNVPAPIVSRIPSGAYIEEWVRQEEH